MTSEGRANLRIASLIMAVNLFINITALAAFNYMRASAMRQASAERQQLSDKMDAAWDQRVRLTAHLERACSR